MPRAVRCVMLAVMVAGCSDASGPHAPALLTRLPRDLTTNETHAAAAANRFALTLFNRVNAVTPADANVFVSPLSVSFALGMTMNGASGTTFDEMRSTLGFGSAELADINDGYRGLMSLEHGLDPTTTFQIANSVWYRQTFTVNQSFKDEVADVFDAEVKASPFDPTTVAAINRWVSDNTSGKISEIIDAIPPDLVMCLVNAIYFKGTWRARFDPARTQNGTFFAAAGDQTVPMMHRDGAEGALLTGGNGEVDVGELVYGNGAFVMTIIMPNLEKTDLTTFASTLDAPAWEALVSGLRDRHLALSLPKFRLEYGRELSNDLKALGMVTPFGQADFTRMSPAGRDLFIEFVQHKTYVDVNEEGTEAAAATNVGIGIVSAPAAFTVNRPFIFAIRERFSGTILFMGKIARIP